MIGNPVALTIRRTIERPAPALVDRYRDAPTGFVTDAFNGEGSMHHGIKPIDPGMKFCGTAVTARCQAGDNLAAMAALDFVQPGDVLVISASGNDTCAVIGDLWAIWAKRIGVVAIIVDGLVRDIPGLLDADIPVFARGHCPNAGYRNGPGEINLGVTCGGVHVGPGDILVGDVDGVVVIPRALAHDVAARLDLVRQKEADALAKVRAGEKLAFWNEAALTAGGGVRYVD
ncbi:MAG: RraA family protein [Burkholderiales bacterium]|nr:RraA family protein [Burkholderiales bacterium]